MITSLTAAADDDGRRLDRVLRKAMPDTALSAIHRLLRKGAVRVNGEIAAANRRIRTGENISVTSVISVIPVISAISAIPVPPSLSKHTFPEILFEGEGLLILNKPAGLSVHGGGSSLKSPEKENLQGLVYAYLKPKLPPSLSFRPGPLHRLDQPSSGVIVFSTNLQGARFFSELMKKRKIKKYYLTLLEGKIEKAEIWQDELVRDQRLKKSFAKTENGKTAKAAKAALTRISPIAVNAGFSLVLAEIETGRTHQIRAQAASRGYPLLGDSKYGSSSKHRGFLLHAWKMKFPDDFHYASLPCLIEAPLPQSFQNAVSKLFGKDTLKLLNTAPVIL